MNPIAAATSAPTTDPVIKLLISNSCSLNRFQEEILHEVSVVVEFAFRNRLVDRHRELTFNFGVDSDFLSLPFLAQLMDQGAFVSLHLDGINEIGSHNTRLDF